MFTFLVGEDAQVEQFEPPESPLWKLPEHTLVLRIATHHSLQVEGSLAAQIPHRETGIHVVFRPEELRSLARQLGELGILDQDDGA